MKVERSVEIVPRHPEAIYEVIMDPACLERWVTIHAALENAPDGQLESGSELTQSLQLAGRGFTVRWTRDRERPRPQGRVGGTGPVALTRRCEYELEPNGEAEPASRTPTSSPFPADRSEGSPGRW